MATLTEFKKARRRLRTLGFTLCREKWYGGIDYAAWRDKANAIWHDHDPLRLEARIHRHLAVGE